MEDMHKEDLQKEDVRSYLAESCDAGMRLDVFIAQKADISRSYARTLMEEGRVEKGGAKVRPNSRVKEGDSIIVRFPEPEPLEAEPEDIPLDIIYEDDDVICVNKARGMVVHPAAGHPDGTLVNALLYHCGSLSGINGVMRPGIVHRLDKDTSGIIIAAKNDAAHRSLARQIEEKTAVRSYLAVARGNVKEDSGEISTLIARDPSDRKKMSAHVKEGRTALTRYEVLERFGKYTFLKCVLATGRTHQIRVHMEYIGHPLVGDPVYSPMKTPFAIRGQALHSYTLDFTHPSTGERMHLEAPLPLDMAKILTRLRNGQF